MPHRAEITASTVPLSHLPLAPILLVGVASRLDPQSTHDPELGRRDSTLTTRHDPRWEVPWTIGIAICRIAGRTVLKVRQVTSRTTDLRIPSDPAMIGWT